MNLAARKPWIAFLPAMILLTFGCSPGQDADKTPVSQATQRPAKTTTLTPTTPPIIRSGAWFGETSNNVTRDIGTILFRINDGGLTLLHINFNPVRSGKQGAISSLIEEEISTQVLTNFDQSGCSLISFHRSLPAGMGPLAPVSNGKFEYRWTVAAEGGTTQRPESDLSVETKAFFHSETEASGSITIHRDFCDVNFLWRAIPIESDAPDEALVQTAEFIPTRTPIPGPEIASMHLKGSSTCALLTTGELWCWGANSSIKAELFSKVPKQVTAFPEKIRKYSGTGNAGCALLESGRVMCWGRNDANQFGNGETGPANTILAEPSETVGIDSSAVDLSGNGMDFCAVLNSGVVKCWGFNRDGMLGKMDSRGIVPVEIQGVGSGAASIHTGGSYHCVLYTSGIVKCWGLYSKAFIRNNVIYPVYTPTALPGFSNITTLSVTSGYPCGLTDTGMVICYGDPEFNPSFSGPVLQIARASNTICGLLVSGSVECWERKLYPQKGESPASLTAIPLLDPSVRMIFGGSLHFCAVLENNVVKCWGKNEFGQLGNGTTDDSALPVGVLWH